MTEYIKNIISDEGSNLTLNEAIKLLDSSSGSLSSMRNKVIGLQLTLIAQSEIQALRVYNLTVAVYRMEEKLYSNENIDTLEPRKLLSLYEKGQSILRESNDFIRRTIRDIDWRNLELDLMNMIEESSVEDLGPGATEEEVEIRKNKLARIARTLLANSKEAELVQDNR